jgi:exodeoxyribonuclease-3
MKFATWNVNGLRACANSFFDYLASTELDFYALQETKLNEPFENLEGLGYTIIWNFGKKQGYSGTAIFCKYKPISIKYGFGEKKYDQEGRIITLEYESYYLINVYVPNSQGGIERWYYRLSFDSKFLDYIDILAKNKNVIICGDLNVAHNYIDIYKDNLRNEEKQHGFTSEEREGLNKLLNLGLIDVFRHFNPNKEDAFTWWSNKFNKQTENRGRRLDYFLVSNNIIQYVKNCKIRSDVYGSDHVPVEMEISI